MDSGIMQSTAFDSRTYLNRELLRLTTAGSVDDGKSTLIGRLLYDSKQIFQDQMDELDRVRLHRGEETVNLALLTDGLRAEREQGITIDVAYRYFSTPRRKFIIADTPGHVQYTRNMVTGASTADLAVILIDARNGVLTQSKRHGFIASLLGIPHLVVAVNKMDLVGWSEDVFNEIVQEYTDFSEKLNIHDISFIPISALNGDNVVEESRNMPWYSGMTVLDYLERVTIKADRNLIDFRFPVQYVIRPHQDFRGFAGRIESGTIRKGEEIIVLPTGIKSRIKSIVTYDKELDEAFEFQSVVLSLEDEIDVSRGDMLVRSHNIPFVETKFDATLCWMDDTKSLSTVHPYILRHTTRSVHAYVRSLNYKIDVDTLHRETADTLILNELGRVEIETVAPVFFDPYERNRHNGGFILVDPATNLTVAAGMIRGETRLFESGGTGSKTEVSSNVVWERSKITREERELNNGHKAHCIWLTGLSGSGKSTIAKELERRFFTKKMQVFILDGDNVRHGLNGDLGFSKEDREENIRRIGHVAQILFDSGKIVICAFISPNSDMRDYVRKLFPPGGFSEVYVKCSVSECKKRDPKGLYKKAEAGEIKNFTGISAPYDTPEKAEVVLSTDELSVEESVNVLEKYIKELY